MRTWRDRWNGLKATTKEDVERKRHKRNMEVVNGMHTEIKRAKTIIQEAEEKQKYMGETEKMYIAFPFLPKGSEQYTELVQPYSESMEGKCPIGRRLEGKGNRNGK